MRLWFLWAVGILLTNVVMAARYVGGFRSFVAECDEWGFCDFSQRLSFNVKYFFPTFLVAVGCFLSTFVLAAATWKGGRRAWQQTGGSPRPPLSRRIRGGVVFGLAVAAPVSSVMTLLIVFVLVREQPLGLALKVIPSAFLLGSSAWIMVSSQRWRGSPAASAPPSPPPVARPGS